MLFIYAVTLFVYAVMLFVYAVTLFIYAVTLFRCAVTLFIYAVMLFIYAVHLCCYAVRLCCYAVQMCSSPRGSSWTCENTKSSFDLWWTNSPRLYNTEIATCSCNSCVITLPVRVSRRQIKELGEFLKIPLLQIPNNFYNRFAIPNKHQILSIRFDETFCGNLVNNFDCRALSLFQTVPGSRIKTHVILCYAQAWRIHPLQIHNNF